jgi:hypothetical protein
MRFLSGIGKDFDGPLEQLNIKYRKWLAEDYLHKAHGSLDGLSPHEALMSQADRLRLPSDRRLIDEAFMLRVSRKIGHDATTQLSNVLYETDPVFAGKRMEIRYEPEWVGDASKKLLIYHEGKAVGEARMVRYHDNAHAKRRKAVPPDIDGLPKNTISFNQAMNAKREG